MPTLKAPAYFQSASPDFAKASSGRPRRERPSSDLDRISCC
jgi:hypothetical protein